MDKTIEEDAEVSAGNTTAGMDSHDKPLFGKKKVIKNFKELNTKSVETWQKT